MKFLRAIAPALALALVVGVASASNDTLADYSNVMSVGVDNQSGGALSNTPIAVQMQPDNLVPDFLQADADDWRPATGGGTAITGVAQGMTTGNNTWWVNIPAQGSGAVAAYDFHMNNTTATRDQTFYVDGTTDTVTAADAASLDITDDLTVQMDVTVGTWPASQTWIFEKSGAYRLGLTTSGGDEAFIGHVYANQTVTLTPDAAGDFENITEEAGCAAGSHWDCLQSNDADTSHILTGGTAGTLFGQDAVNVGAPPSGTFVVDDVDIACETVGDTASLLRVGVRLGGTTGTMQTPTDFSCGGVSNFARPGGGSWTTTDLASVQVVVEITDDLVGKAERFQYAAIVVTLSTPVLTATTDDAAGALVTGTEYTVELNYDRTGSPQYTLQVNGSVRDSDADIGGAAVATNANALVLQSFAGSADSVQVGDTSIATPTVQLNWEFEPDQMAETQQGNSGNSWTWTGTVDDQSAGGTNDGTYSLTRDMTGITIWTYNFRNKTATVAISREGVVDTLGAVVPDADATRTAESFPFRSLVTNIENPDFGVSTIAAWFVLLLIVGIGLSVAIFKATDGVAWLAGIGLPLVFWAGWMAGTPIPWWMPAFMTLIMFGFATGVKRFAGQ